MIIGDELLSNITFIVQGSLVTVKLLLGSIMIGLCLGVTLSIIRHAKVKLLVIPINIFISIVRGTPLLLQLVLFYFIVPNWFGVKFGALAAGIIAFGLNSSAYIAEIIRAGIESLPKGQFEAAQTLQIPKFLMWKDIILPQVIRNILPALLNEVISLLKETALIATLGVLDLTQRARVVSAEQLNFFEPILIAGACYYIMVLFVEKMGKIIEKRSQYVKNT